MPETILVVDDDIDILELLKLSLESDGFNVRTANDGESSLGIARTYLPDLILLDIMMPNKDGLAVINELKGDGETKQIPVILLTARGQTEDKVRGLDTGADDYITKPFDLREVTARIKAVLGRTRQIKYINPLMHAMGDRFSEQGVQQLVGHLQAAAAIQQKLLPEKTPNLPGVEIAARLQSSTAVSGDFYDFIPLSKTQIGIVQGDVVGSGIPAALLMVMIQTALRLLCTEQHSPATILKRINDLLVRDTDPEVYATIIYGILDTELFTFTYSNGGHCYPLHWQHGTPQEKIELLKIGGMLVGTFKDATFTTGTCLLAPGDVLVFYTDGITETVGPTESVEEAFYGVERLVGWLTQKLQTANNESSISASVLCDTLITELAQFSGSPQPADDRSLIIIKRDA